MQDKFVRVGVFYDGNYFLRVSNYYAYGHQRRKRISVSGLHAFIKNQVSDEEDVDSKFCQIVDAHYFRGRLNASEASQRGDTLYNDRVFDDVLMSEGVTTHYLPIKIGFEGQKLEKGIDVLLALEAFELSIYKKFDVLVLVASDSDYVPLVRKLNTLGTRVMVLGWDFDYTSENGQKYTTRTSQELLEEVTYPIQMSKIIDDRISKNESVINGLFVQTDQRRFIESYSTNNDLGLKSEILTLKNGYGFIKYPPNNLYFHYSNVVGTDFNELQVGDKVGFYIDKNEVGEDVAKNVKLIK